MLKILDQRAGSYPVVDLSPGYEKTVASCQPRRSQRHGGVTSLNPTPEPTLAQEDRNILHRLSGVDHGVTPDPSDETEPQQSSGSDLMPVSAMSGAPRRSQRSHKRSRFMDDEYLSTPVVSRTAVSDDVKVLEQRKNLANEPAPKRRSLKGSSSSENSAKNSPKTAIHSTSPAQNMKGISRAVTRRSLGPVVRYPIGTRLNVKYGAVNPQIYEAKVIEVDVSAQVPRYRVHYRGWNKSHDSWITKIDVVSIIEKASSPNATSSGETVKPPPPDITTPRISTKVVLTDCRLSGRSGRDSKIGEETDPDAKTQGKKRKQDSEEEEDGGECIGEGQTRSGRRKQSCANSLPSTNDNPGGEANSDSSHGGLVAERSGESESETVEETDGSSLESVAEESVAPETAEQEEPDGDEESAQVEDGERGDSGTEEENGEEDGQKGSIGTEKENDEEDGQKASSGMDEEKEEDDGSKRADDDGERDETGSEDGCGRKDDDEDGKDGEDEDGEKEEKDDEEEEDGAEECSYDLEDRSSRRSIPASVCETTGRGPPSLSNEENEENLPDETSVRSLNFEQSGSNQKPTAIYDSIMTSESSSCESDSMEPAFGCDAKNTTADDFLNEETAHDDVSVSNSNSDDACNELLPAETDSVRSGGTSSIASDHQCRPDSSGNTTTSSSSQLSQLDDAESARHFATIHRSSTYRTNFIDLDAELKGLDDAEKEDYILSKMRKIQIEYKHMSSLYNKLTRRSNRASNRKKSRSRRNGSSATITTADTEDSPVC